MIRQLIQLIKPRALIPFGLLIVLLSPLYRQLGTRRNWLTLVDLGLDSWRDSFLHSTLFATLTATFSLLAGFLLAVCLRRLSNRHFALAAALLIPALLGAVPIGFLFKLALSDSTLLSGILADRAPVPTWSFLFVVQCTQQLSLAAYVLAIRLRARDLPLPFFRFHRASAAERFRHIYWPKAKSTFLLLAFLFTAEGLQEFNGLNIIIRTSPGTDTELATQRILRYYKSLASSDYEFARGQGIFLSLVLVVVGILSAIFVYYLCILIMEASIRILSQVKRESVIHLGSVIYGVLFMAAAAFIGVQLIPNHHLPSWQQIQWGEAFVSATLSAGPTLLALLVAAAYSTSIRSIFPYRLQKFDSQSIPLFVILFLILFVPDTGISFSSLHWLKLLGGGDASPLILGIFWHLGQVILVFPIVASFLLLSYTKVRAQEIFFATAYRLPFLFRTWHLYIGRFKVDYILVGIFSFSLIWGEGNFTSTISDLSSGVPSLAVSLQSRVDGRGAHYPEAVSLIAISIIPIAILLFAWRVMVARSEYAGED